MWRWLLIYSDLDSPGFLCIHGLVSFISSSSFLATLSSNIPSLHSLFWHFKQPYVSHSYPIVQDSWTLSLYSQSIFLSMVQNLFDLIPAYSLFFIYVYNTIKPTHDTFNYNHCIFFSFSEVSLDWFSHLFSYICSFLCPEEIFKFVFNLRILFCTIPVFGLLAGLLLLWVDSKASLSRCPLFLWASFTWAVHCLFPLKSFILFVR